MVKVNVQTAFTPVWRFTMNFFVILPSKIIGFKIEGLNSMPLLYKYAFGGDDAKK